MDRNQQTKILLFDLRRQLLNGLAIAVSVLFCALLSLARLPGMELLGIGPHWLLIWVVVWSLRRSSLQGTVAGMALGWVQDGLSSTYPSHLLSLGLVGFLTARLPKTRYLQENFVALALVTFLMAGLAEGITAIQLVTEGSRPLEELWQDYQRIALSTALLSSLWAPALAYPLNCWWEKLEVFK